MTPRTLLAAAAGLALVASLAGCAPSVSTGAPADGDAPPKTPTEACLGVAQETSSRWVTTDDGTFDVGMIGGGEVTAILVHQMNENECGWFPFAANLADEGVRVLLLNLCGYGETTCSGGSLTGTGADAVLATADWARQDGAERVVVVGASIGGTTAMIAAAHDAGAGLLDGVADALASAEVTLLDDANGHGWDMLNGPAGPDRQTVAEQLTAFVLG